MNSTKEIFATTKQLTKQSVWKRYFIIVMSGFLFTIASKFFIIYAQIFSPGIAGFSQGVVYTIYEGVERANPGALDYVVFTNSFYWVIYGILNIPIIYFTYKKFGQKFLFDSMVTFTASLSLQMFLTYAPGVKEASFIPGYLPNEPIAGLSSPVVEYAIKYTITLLSGILAGIMYGIAVGMVFSQSATSMGFDPIAKYLERDKDISLKQVLFWFSFANSMFWIFVTESIAGTITNHQEFWSVLISPRVLATILFLSFYSLIGEITSKDKNIKLEINSSKSRDIANWIKHSTLGRTFSLNTIIGAYSQQKREVIEIIMLKSEVPEFMDGIHEIDPNAFIVSSRIEDIYGNFNRKSSSKYERMIEEHRSRMANRSNSSNQHRKNINKHK